MAFSLISNVGTGSTNGGVSVTTSAIDTTGADFIVVSITRWTGGSVTFTDSKGNTWTALTEFTYSTIGCRLYYCVNPTVGTGHTFSQTGSTTYATICASAWDSGGTGVLIDQSANNGTYNAQLYPGSITPTTNDQLLISALGFDNGETVSITGGFTITNQVPRADGPTQGHEGGAMAYLIQTTAAAANPSWDWTSSTDSIAGLVSFRATTGGGTPAGVKARYRREQLLLP